MYSNPRRRRGVRAVVCSAALALLVAGGATGPASAGSPPKATCKLLKPSEIEEVIGQSVGKGRKSRLRSNICEWAVTGSPGSLISVLLDRGRTASSNFDTAPVNGLGSDAFYADGLDTVWVVKNKRTLFFVQGLSGAEGLPRAQLLELARVALPRA